MAEGCWLSVTVLYGYTVKPSGGCHFPLGKLGLTLGIECMSPLKPPPPPPSFTKVSSVFDYCHRQVFV